MMNGVRKVSKGARRVSDDARKVSHGVGKVRLCKEEFRWCQEGVSDGVRKYPEYMVKNFWRPSLWSN